MKIFLKREIWTCRERLAGAAADRTKTSERGVENVFCAGVGVALSGWMRAENSTYFEDLSWRGAGRSRRLGMICRKVLKEGRAALIDRRMPEA